MNKKILFGIVFVPLVVIVISGCVKEPEQLEIDRNSKIPTDIVKGTPENDNYPPILHSDEYEEPVPLAVINTAGAEDSPFIPADRDELYFVFVKDVREEIHIQIKDAVNGIWVSKFINSAWQEPELILLQKPGKLALNGCEFVQGNKMVFCSAREGYTGVHWFSAEFKDGKWTNWKNADFPSRYDVGELHISGNELYYHSDKKGGKGGRDIWMLTKVEDEWKNPINVEAVNSESNEGMPYITPNGKELWFNRQYQGSPAVYRSKKADDEWQEPSLIVSQFAGEPTLDKKGNIYFVHHYYKDGVMIEADIYVAYKK
jgi:hypothetical protein